MMMMMMMILPMVSKNCMKTPSGSLKGLAGVLIVLRYAA